jgi:hypothetical protein
MKTITKFIYAAFAALALACVDTASALTIYPINNGFEQPDLGSGCFAYQYNPSNPGWTFTNSSGIAANESCFDVAGATNGNNDNHATSISGQTAFLQGGDGTLAGVSFSQTLTLPTAGNWVAYLNLEGRPYYDGPNGVNVFLDGVQVGTSLFPANLGSFNGASVNLGNLTAGSHTIGFAGTAPEGDHTTFVDNVRLASGATADLFASINGVGISDGSIYQYTPFQTTFASALPLPRGLAFDSAGNLFVATNFYDANLDTYQATILKITPGGTQSTFATFSGNVVASGLAIDRSDNVLVMVRVDLINPPYPSTIYKFTPGGVQSTFGSIPGQGWGLAFDNAGNLFAADGWDQTIYRFTPDGTASVFAGPAAFSSGQAPVGFAFDKFGNLFVSTQGHPGSDAILKFTPAAVESTFATRLNYPRGLAFDSAGNLFVTEVLGSDILKFTPGGRKSVFASGLADGPEYLTIQPACTWGARTPIPQAVFGASGITFNGQLYVIDGGGMPAPQVYDPVSNSWSFKAPDPVVRALASAGVINNKIYVAEGWLNSDSNTPTTALGIYDPATNSWTTGAPSQLARGNAASAVIGSKLYITGGRASCCSNEFATLEIYDSLANSWSTRAPIPLAAEGSAGVALNGKFYVVGGFARPGNFDTGALQIYNPARNTWTNGAPMPTPRSGLIAVVFGGKLYAIGGNIAFVGSTPTVEIYDPASNTWTTGTPEPTARYGGAGGIANGILYVTGGYNPLGVIDGSLDGFNPRCSP